jgi:hypothetical protein
MRSIGIIGLIGLFVGVLLTACGAPAGQQALDAPDAPDAPVARVMNVYKSPTCGCCSDWVGYVEQHGFTVTVEDVADLAAIKAEHKIPAAMQSCHTALVDGYVIEGHVPVKDIERLLAERPDVVGIAVPGMPIGSPGMEVAGTAPEPFDVVAFDASGNTAVFASYHR